MPSPPIIGEDCRKLQLWLASKGVRVTAGFKPTTQGKDERSHQTIVRFLDVRKPTTITEVAAYIEDYRHGYNHVRRHQGLLVGKMHITPYTAWATFPRAHSRTTPLSEDELWQRVHAHSNPKRPLARQRKDLAEAATSTRPNASENDTTSTSDIDSDSPTVTANYDGIANEWGIAHTVPITKYGCVQVCRHRLYVGSRFRNRMLYTNVTADNVAEFYTAHDEELLFSFPLPLTLKLKPAGAQININHVEGAWHRMPPRVTEALSKPRPSSRKP